MEFRCTVTEGKIRISNRDIFQMEVKALEGKKLILTIKEMKSQRSLNQNAYYWGVVLPILGKELGYTDKEMHRVLRNKFLKEPFSFKDEDFVDIKSTTDLNTKEFEVYMEQIRQWASQDMQIWIPEPNEDYEYVIQGR